MWVCLFVCARVCVCVCVWLCMCTRVRDRDIKRERENNRGSNGGIMRSSESAVSPISIHYPPPTQALAPSRPDFPCRAVPRACAYHHAALIVPVTVWSKTPDRGLSDRVCVSVGVCIGGGEDWTDPAITDGLWVWKRHMAFNYSFFPRFQIWFLSGCQVGLTNSIKSLVVRTDQESDIKDILRAGGEPLGSDPVPWAQCHCCVYLWLHSPSVCQ